MFSLFFRPSRARNSPLSLGVKCCEFFILIALNLALHPQLQAQTHVPLLFPENKNERGELIPIPERYRLMLQTVETDTNVQFDLKIFPWNRAVKNAASDGDLIFGLSKTTEREEIFEFSEPVSYNNLWLVTRADKAFPYASIKDLKGKTIGVVRGSKYGGEFDQYKNSLFKTDDDIDGYSPRLQKVLNLRVDAMLYPSPLSDPKAVEIIVNEIVIADLAKTTASNRRFAVLPVPVFRDGIRFAILKGRNHELIMAINRSVSKHAASSPSMHKSSKRKSR